MTLLDTRPTEAPEVDDAPFTPRPSWAHTTYYATNRADSSANVDYSISRHRVASDDAWTIRDIDAWLSARDHQCARRTFSWHKRVDGTFRAVVVHWSRLGEVAWTSHYDAGCLRECWRQMYAEGEIGNPSRDAFRVFVFVGKVECEGVTR